MKNLGKAVLLTIFLTGASVMVLEIAAMRLFAPYFGNTLYTSSSIIGVILGALSLGYYFGGKLADRHPTPLLFYGIILASGVLTLFLHTLHKFLLPAFSPGVSVIGGSLLFSSTLFFLPSLTLGTLSPFAVKLRSISSPKAGAGTTSGQIFFVGTVGSILGSFLTGFYLIPHFGVDSIISGVALLLFAIGFVGISLIKKKTSAKLFLALGVFTMLAWVNNSFFYKSSKVIFAKEGVYQKIQVIKGEINGKQAKLLLQDKNYSSAMYMDSDELVFDYTKYTDLIKNINSPKTALVVGAGAYTVPKYLVSIYPQILVDVVEIEPELYSISKEYFRLSENPRIKNITADGRRFFVGSDKKYDFIFLDAYSSLFSVPSHLVTAEFFEVVKSHLEENGIVVANMIGQSGGNFISSAAETWAKAFGEDKSYFYLTLGKVFNKPQNIMFVATNAKTKLAGFEDKSVSRNYFGKAEAFTDDFVPSDYFLMGEFEKY